jgi:tetratricopeptide (TPR) repeat protein
LQNDFFKLFPGDLDGAEANIFRTLDLLDPVLPSHPNDWFLQNVRAYAFKNYAMVMRNRGKLEGFDHALDEAEKMFEIVRQQQPDDPAAWNGLGSVALLRGQPDHALAYIDRALEIQPNYGAAKHDREIALQMLKRQEIDSMSLRP